MGKDPFIHEAVIQDKSGGTWRAKQILGMGTEGMGEALGTHVEFVNEVYGMLLEGRVIGIAPASDDELRIALEGAIWKSRYLSGYDK